MVVRPTAGHLFQLLVRREAPLAVVDRQHAIGNLAERCARCGAGRPLGVMSGQPRNATRTCCAPTHLRLGILCKIFLVDSAACDVAASLEDLIAHLHRQACPEARASTPPPDSAQRERRTVVSFGPTAHATSSMGRATQRTVLQVENAGLAHVLELGAGLADLGALEAHALTGQPTEDGEWPRANLQRERPRAVSLVRSSQRQSCPGTPRRNNGRHCRGTLHSSPYFSLVCGAAMWGRRLGPTVGHVRVSKESRAVARRRRAQRTMRT